MEKLFFFLSRPEDLILVKDGLDPNLLADWKELGWEMGTETKEGFLLPEDLSLVEWGQLHNFTDGSLVIDPSLLEKSSYLNSKLIQNDWKEDSGLSPLWTKRISSEDSLIDFLNELESPVVLKSEFGLAGRNQIAITSKSQSWKLQQITKRLFRYPILAEEWVGESRFYDFSTLWDFSNTGPVYLGSTEMIVEEDGTFRGIKMSPQTEINLVPYLDLCFHTVKTVSRTSEFSHLGPAAMDGFLFRSQEGKTVCQPMSEINFRYSMGRILYEIRKRRLVKEFESGILFLPLSKIKSWSEWAWISKLRNDTNSVLFYVTPARDERGKLFQNVGLYYEANEQMDGPSLFAKIAEEWQALGM